MRTTITSEEEKMILDYIYTIHLIAILENNKQKGYLVISFALTIFQNVNTFIERKNLNIIEIMENTSLFRYKKILYNLENK
ncbi:hypothetical protein LC087_12790 [Bacillus carboniphilus]|uniref:Uncharacterized protein n=1 Tax=Bacillus carboniphilus TaxID=86663 RepID=A0ABY9JQQ3_9BACI|nr:hypothetical protein [Bacillus carboniphilus]WLR41736.1 hypothetical protein LC087_12790 [Bacillus carboniphilus]